MKTSKRYKRRTRGVLKLADRSDPVGNLQNKVSRARTGLHTLGVTHGWENTVWALSPTLFSLTGKHIESVSINFSLPPALGSDALRNSWADAARLFFVLRENERHKSISSHRTFVATIGYIQAAALNHELERLTPAILDHACKLLERDIHSSGELYKRHNLVLEFARRCSELGLCHVDLGSYHYHGLSRPDNYGGRSDKRLDDPALLTEQSPRLIAASTFQILGELYRNLPRNHKYRIHLLIITLLVCLGRRLSEITLLPRQRLIKKESGYYFVYLKLKGAFGSRQYELVTQAVITETVPLVESVLAELEDTSEDVYACAEEMCRTNGPDLRFLAGLAENDEVYYDTLIAFGLPKSLFKYGWLVEQGLVKRNYILPGGIQKSGYLLRRDIESYCWSHFQPRMTQPLFYAEGKEYYIKDMLLLKRLGTSSGHYARWIADTVTAAMFDKFILQLEPLCHEFASGLIDQKFTSHAFRHTMNDALDQGNLPELLQTEYFGRKNPADTKAYQHTSPQKRALQIREEIKLGKIGGSLADRVMRLPEDRRDAFVATKFKAVHDLGNGMCFHAWEAGPCQRHEECDGCSHFGWLKDLPDPAAVYDDLMRQASQHLIQLEMGDRIFPLADGTDANWRKHLCLKIYHIIDRADEISAGTDISHIYNYINGGEFDKHVVPGLLAAAGRGFELYVRFRDEFNELCKDYAASFFEKTPFLPVKVLS